jgi:hypothetical protein
MQLYVSLRGQKKLTTLTTTTNNLFKNKGSGLRRVVGGLLWEQDLSANVNPSYPTNKPITLKTSVPSILRKRGKP